MEIPKSTVRFAQVVKKCGRPEPVTLWVNPKKDRKFQTAVEENRVMTVIQETVGTHKDFAVMGFRRAEHASYWIFPKSLDAFKDKRVIGIQYDLLNLPKPKDLVKATQEPVKPSPANREAKEVKPELVRYRVTVRCSATVDIQREVEAKTAKEAGELALRVVANEAVDFGGNVSRKITEVHRAAKA